MGSVYKLARKPSGMVRPLSGAGKRGVELILCHRFRSYNWASSRNSGDKHPTINYVPMLHGKAVPQEDKPALFDKDKAKFKEWGVTHILSFNEPDVSWPVLVSCLLIGLTPSPVTTATDISRRLRHDSR